MNELVCPICQGNGPQISVLVCQKCEKGLSSMTFTERLLRQGLLDASEAIKILSADLTLERQKREAAEAACAEMRDALEEVQLHHGPRFSDQTRLEVRAALSLDAGHDYISPEQVAALKDLLEECQWAAPMEPEQSQYCPICLRWNINGKHMPDCALAKAIAKEKGTK